MRIDYYLLGWVARMRNGSPAATVLAWVCLVGISFFLGLCLLSLIPRAPAPVYGATTVQEGQRVHLDGTLMPLTPGWQVLKLRTEDRWVVVATAAARAPIDGFVQALPPGTAKRLMTRMSSEQQAKLYRAMYVQESPVPQPPKPPDLEAVLILVLLCLPGWLGLVSLLYHRFCVFDAGGTLTAEPPAVRFSFDESVIVSGIGYCVNERKYHVQSGYEPSRERGGAPDILVSTPAVLHMSGPDRADVYVTLDVILEENSTRHGAIIAIRKVERHYRIEIPCASITTLQPGWLYGAFQRWSALDVRWADRNEGHQRRLVVGCESETSRDHLAAALRVVARP